MTEIWKILIIAFFLALTLSIKVSSQSYPYRHYSVDDGLNSNIVYDIIQDEKGFIWFATSAGICKFDGKEFQRISIDEVNADNEVLKIKTDKEHRLWLLHFNGTVSIIEKGRVSAQAEYPVLKKIGPGFFYFSMYADTSGFYWLTTRGDNNCRIKLPSDAELLPVDSSAIFQTKDGYWYLPKFMEFNKTNKFASKENYPVGAKLYMWDYAGDSLILMLTDSGIYTINRNNKIDRYPIDYPLNVNSLDLYCDNNLGLWICRPHGGVYYYEKSNEGYRLFDIFLKDEYVTSTFRDNEGNVWFSLHGGGVIMMPWNFKTVRSYSKNDGLQDNEVYSVYVDSRDRIWFGHKYGFIDCIDSGRMHHMRMPQSSNSLGRVLKISEHPEGYMAFAGDDGMCFLNMQDPVSKLRPVKFNFSDNRIAYSQPIKDFSFNDTGDVYIVSQEAIQFMSKKDITSGRLVTTKLQLPRKRYYSLCFDDRQDILFSDFDGLKKINSGIPVSLTDKYPILKIRIVDMCEVKGSIIVSVLGSGLVVLKDDKVTQYLTTKDGLLSNHCSRLFSIGDQVLVCTNIGLNVIHQQTDGIYNIDQVTAADGLVSSQVNDAFAKNNVIYAATLKGVSEIRLNEKERNRQVPLVYFTKITWQGKDITNLINPEIGYVDKYLRFDYISPFYTFPEGVSYQYSLNKGEWISTQNTTIEFNSLLPGDYLLQIRTRHLNSDWSKAISYPFIILQPFYKSTWFYFLSIFVIVIALITIYAFRIRRIRKEQALTLGYEQKINLLQTQALQAMMNPHFIFNSLSAIQQQISAGDNIKAGSYLSRFAKLLRKNLETINESYITLESELERLNLYLESEKMRLEERLEYKIEIGKNLQPAAILIPTMILQPIIENAIWHGLMPKGFGFVKVEMEGVNENLIIRIIDDGIGINQSQRSDQRNKDRRQFGLNITKERLAILEKKLGKAVTIDITDLSMEGLTGTRVTISLPLISDANHSLIIFLV